MKIVLELEVQDCDRRQLNNVLAKLEYDIHALIKSDRSTTIQDGKEYGKYYNLSVEISEEN